MRSAIVLHKVAQLNKKRSNNKKKIKSSFQPFRQIGEAPIWSFIPPIHPQTFTSQPIVGYQPAYCWLQPAYCWYCQMPTYNLASQPIVTSANILVVLSVCYHLPTYWWRGRGGRREAGLGFLWWAALWLPHYLTDLLSLGFILLLLPPGLRK